MMAGRIFVDVTHPIPVIHWDPRGGRERRACLVGCIHTELRVVAVDALAPPP